MVNDRRPPLGLELKQGGTQTNGDAPRITISTRTTPIRKLCTALLLGVVPIGLVSPGDLAVGQHGTGTAPQAPLYTVIDLHPSGFIRSLALGISDGEQVGVGSTKGDYDHALLWRGSAASVVDLNPSQGNFATGTCGGQQVGWGHGFGATGKNTHALLWRGGAGSAVDLHPRGFTDSEALGTSGREQVGFGNSATGGSHALLWRGSAANVVDLHPRGFVDSQATGTSDGQQVGYGYGPVTGGLNHALLWRGSAASIVDLHPRGFADSRALATSGVEQVGQGDIISANTPGDSTSHALLWRGNAGTVVDLNPHGVGSSTAQATNGEEQVGDGDGHALLWHSSAASVVDLHAFLPPGFSISSALGIDTVGNIVGSASAGRYSPDRAILWKRNAPKPNTSRAQNNTGC